MNNQNNTPDNSSKDNKNFFDELQKEADNLEQKLNLIDEVDKLTKEVLKEKNELISSNFKEVIKDFPEIQAGIELDEYALEVALTGEGLSEILSNLK